MQLCMWWEAWQKPVTKACEKPVHSTECGTGCAFMERQTDNENVGFRCLMSSLFTPCNGGCKNLITWLCQVRRLLGQMQWGMQMEADIWLGRTASIWVWVLTTCRRYYKYWHGLCGIPVYDVVVRCKLHVRRVWTIYLEWRRRNNSACSKSCCRCFWSVVIRNDNDTIDGYCGYVFWSEV